MGHQAGDLTMLRCAPESCAKLCRCRGTLHASESNKTCVAEAYSWDEEMPGEGRTSRRMPCGAKSSPRLRKVACLATT
jgi:hypothetical protein